MKNSKRMLCLVLAIVVMLGSMGLVSAFAETQSGSSSTTNLIGTTIEAKNYKENSNNSESKYFLKFSESDLKTPKLLSCDEMTTLFGEKTDVTAEEFVCKENITNNTKGSSAKLNSDSSITMTKSGDQYGTNLEIPVTDEMKEAYKNASDKSLIISYYLTKAAVPSGTNAGEFTDCQFRVYTRFKNAYEENKSGVVYKRYIKSSTIGKNAYECYQQNLNKSFNLVDAKGNVLENLDDVESLIFSLYNFTEVDASIEVSSILFEGTPSIKEFQSPTPAKVGEAVSMTDWSRYYFKSGFGDVPNTVKYSSEGGYVASKYKTMRNSGWAYFNNEAELTNRQINLFFNLNRDAFNKAIVSANQEGGDHKLTITGMFPKIQDTNNKSMVAELQIQFYTYDGQSITPVQKWVEPGKEFKFEIDTTNITVNSVKYLKIALMAFWKYDPADDKFYDIDQAKKYDKDGNLLTPKYDEGGSLLGYDNGKSSELLTENDVKKVTANCSDGRKEVDVTSRLSSLTRRVMKNVECFVSPFYAGKAASSTPTAATTTAVTDDGDYKYAGYHFYDFTEQAYSEFYGLYSHASFANFLYEDYYNQYEVIDKKYDTDGTKQGFKNATPTKVDADDKYKADFAEAKSLVSNGYQFELNSPYPRTQKQHQASFYISGKDEDADRQKASSEHISMPAQNEKYDFSEQMKNGLKYAKENPDPTKKGKLAIDVYVINNVHGYKNIYNSTYKAWCQKNGKKVENEYSPVQVQLNIAATSGGEDASVQAYSFLQVGQKKTLYVDVSELEFEDINSISVQAQNYANMANKEQGGDDGLCGITDTQVRISAVYIPGNKNTDLTTTVNVTRPFNLSDAKKIKKLYDALPGLKVSDYKTMADYKKLSNFIKAWTKASEATQKYCEEKYGIDYSKIGMLEADVYEKLFGSGAGDDSNGGTSPGTGDIAFPMLSLVVAGLAGYVIVKTRKKKSV